MSRSKESEGGRKEESTELLKAVSRGPWATGNLGDRLCFKNPI